MAVHIRVLTRRWVPWTNPACIGQSGVPWRRARMTTTTTRGGLRCIHADAEDLHGGAAVRRYARRLAAEHAELSARLRHAGLGEEERRRLNRRCADLAPVADACERIRGAVADLGEVLSLGELGTEDDQQMAQLLKDEEVQISNRIEVLKRDLVNVLLPSDRLDSSNVVLEVSAGRTTGGDICQQFTREMFDMYQGFASYKNWTFDLLNYTHAEYGGLHHAAVQITGDSVYRYLKHEGGTHRVQRIPEVGLSSRMQRIHTGTMAVIILPQPLELELRIDAKDLRVDTFRSRGAGGQSVNTTDSAVRIVHLPSGTVVECQQSRSQLQNRDTAMAMLRARLHQSVLGQETEKRHTSRKKQVGTRSQSERIRSYNFSQDRVTDHRTGYVSRDLKEFMKGGEALDDLICNVLEHGEREALLDLVERESGVKQPGSGQNVE
ncbi:Peptide chain release factor 1, mitochondrial [Merluccius polli]|uniref:Peptide chain release factor 1, mitochondrial n=1 Tax=Merluccius polli TaxID=89951 RepID=A0AA47NXH2_MERPO|nr:Peptide chain release factor 1, mitochondrial [Merluccius polli]